MSMKEQFLHLHEQGTFVIPNPWDPGSAVVLEGLGFKALATTSAGLGRAIGKDDQQVTRNELIDHVGLMAGVIGVPLSVDSERMFPDDEGGIARTAELIDAAGAAGCSIEDYDPASDQIDPLEKALEAVAEAVRVCDRLGLVLTARAENHLYGIDDLDDTITRLIAFRDAGAHVVYAPGLVELSDIERLVKAVSPTPVNVLAMPVGPSVSELAEVGVRRVSTGSSLFNASRRTLIASASELKESGTSGYALG